MSDRSLPRPSPRRFAVLLLAALIATGCAEEAPRTRVRASGQVEATAVQVAGQIGGRLTELTAEEGDRVARGDLVARIDTRDIELARQRAGAERRQAAAQLALLEAGARVQDIRQAEAQLAGAGADTRAAVAELESAEADLERFETLLAANSGSRKQRDDAQTRRDVAAQRVQASRERERAARETLERLRAGARPEELEAARARVAVADAQIATLEKNLEDAVIQAPIDGVVTERLAEPGEIVGPGVPLLVVTDLDRAWADVFLDEPDVPRVRLGQEATVFTDAGGPGIPGTVTFVSPTAEFTPRNVQTAEERSKLVYRVKVSVDNRDGVLKVGMPIEAEVPLQGATSDAR